MQLDEMSLTLVTVEEMTALANAAEFVLANMSKAAPGYVILESAHSKLLAALDEGEGETLQ